MTCSPFFVFSTSGIPSSDDLGRALEVGKDLVE